jgi:phage protein D
MEAEVISNNYYAADRFSASVALDNDPQVGMPFWASEADVMLDIQFSLDGGTTFVSLIRGTVDCVVIDPLGGSVHLEGRDLTVPLLETRTHETFANRTSSEIATLLAGRHNLTPCVCPTITPVGRYYQDEHDRITLNQFSRTTTEWDLLVFLARQEGFDVFVEGATLNFQPSAQSIDAAVLLHPNDLLELRLERSLTLAHDIEVVVKSWNSRQNSAFAQSALGACSSDTRGSDPSAASPQRYVLVEPNLTPDQALRLAQRRLAELTRHERVMEFSMPGELVLTPRSTVMLDGSSSEFDQVYYVDVIERRLRYDGGFIQRVRATNTSPRTGSTASTNVPDSNSA